jgi:peroxiredoxin (alkyl hydroperoxide reductase subunit C)
MENNRILIGQKFPELTVNTTHGKKVLPKDYEGKWLILFSHPADFTPVCTTEFVAFQKRYEEFKKLNTELLGLSIDQVFSHIKWTEWINDNLGVKIEFPIIADDKGTVADLLGMTMEGATNTIRAVFFIDPNGIIRAIIYYPQELGRNFDEILRVIKGLQTSTEKGVAIPADWPNNKDLDLKDRVIVPPAATEEEKELRLKQAENGEIKCFDWWFCHKSND